MFGLSVVQNEKKEPSEVDLFRQELEGDLETIGKAIIPEIRKAETAGDNVTRLQASIVALEEQVAGKEQEAETIRELAAEAAIQGEDVSGQISRRAVLLAEIQAMKDLTADMRKQVPAVQQVARNVSRITSDHIAGELGRVATEHQKKLDAKAQEIAEMVKAFQPTLNEFISVSFPEFFSSGKQIPCVGVPDIHRLLQLMG